MMACSAAVAVVAATTLDQEPFQLQQLPKGLLQHILSCLDLYSLLEASTVSREFRAAAAAALSRISLKHVYGRALRHLYSYLRHQGWPYLTSLTLSSKPDDLMDNGRYGGYCCITQLPPLPSLQQLSLAGFILQLGPVSGSDKPGVLAAAAAAAGTRLTLLSIDKCRLLDGPGGLEAVSALRSLRHLHLGWASLVFRSPNDTAKDDNYTFPGSLLSVLVQLTHLSIGLTVDTPSLQHLSCLAGLQELLVPHYVWCNYRSADLAALQQAQQLSKVVLGMPSREPLSASALQPGASGGSASGSADFPLRAVKHLELEVRAAFDPAVLAPLAQLQHLQYTEDAVRSTGLVGGPGALLGQLALHTQLTFLQLDCGLVLGPEVPAAALSAITASSQLQHLVLRIPTTESVQQTPFQSVWQHVFPEQLQLPHLRHLTLSSRALYLLDEPTLADVISSVGSIDAPPPWQDQCVSRLALCCPNLQDLDVLHALQGRLSRTSLLQLPHLTSLAVQYISYAEVKALVARLRGLVRLQVGWYSVPGCISAAGLARLTALQLTYLSLTGDDMFPPDSDEDDSSIWDPEEAADMRAYAPFRVVDATLSIIARLSSLRELLVKQHPSLTDAGLLQLSALRQLTHLDVRDAFGLLGFDEDGRWVYLPTRDWARGLTLGQPIWPELLERVLRSHDPSARRQAQKAVLANRQALLGVLGPGLAAALPRMRFHRSYEQLDAEVERWGVDVCSWGSGSGMLPATGRSSASSSAASSGSSDSESGEGPGHVHLARCEPQECTAGSPAGPDADISVQPGVESGSSSSTGSAAAVGAAAAEPSAAAAAATATATAAPMAAAGGLAASQERGSLTGTSSPAAVPTQSIAAVGSAVGQQAGAGLAPVPHAALPPAVAEEVSLATEALVQRLQHFEALAAHMAAATPARSAAEAGRAGRRAPVVGTWQPPGGWEAVLMAADTAAAPSVDAELPIGAAAGAAGRAAPAVTGRAVPLPRGAAAGAAEVGAAEGAAGGAKAVAEEVIRTADTAMRERLSFVVRLLAAHSGPSG